MTPPGSRALSGSELERKVAIVTGASRIAGIGAAIATELAADGWDLLLTGYERYDRDSGLASDGDGVQAVAERVASGAHGRRIETLHADLTDPDAPTRIVDACHARLGPPSALINNATVSVRGGLLEVNAAELDRHWAVNARAPLLLTAAFARRFEGEAGSVVNLTSGQSFGPMPGEIAYTTTKGALEAFTLQAAAELAPRGIRVNAVDPGATDTGWMTDADRAGLVAPLGRLGLPEDAARLVRFLCSHDGRWITGQVVRSRGGL